MIIWLHANYLFYVKIHVKCEWKLWKGKKKKKKKKKCGMWESSRLIKMLFVIDEPAIGLL